jgi:DNA-binding GntR family transcriptional regulator
LAAVERGDAEQAGSLTREHIMGFYRRFLTGRSRTG